MGEKSMNQLKKRWKKLNAPKTDKFYPAHAQGVAAAVPHAVPQHHWCGAYLKIADMKGSGQWQEMSF